jgi:hypothetical protein
MNLLCKIIGHKYIILDLVTPPQLPSPTFYGTPLVKSIVPWLLCTRCDEMYASKKNLYDEIR